MKAIALRAVAAAVLASVTLAGAVLAADPTAPPTVGGNIHASGDLVRITSLGNVPASVTLTAQVATLSESSFDIEPGETHDIHLSGDIRGDVSALFTTKPSGVSLDVGTAELVVTLRPYTPPFDWTPLWLALIALAAVFVTWRAVRWGRRHIRIVHPEVTP